ncbi:hypothetical protein DSO57_1037654 [Entomophthora muscae]|uniref:Uncharacterized protein n=1 Tax=Entomophthora muscae TaxID=34485 RepID=A0ACC2UJQ4_9FUNG|nr:hypothetical protein DSO57_1037654 [Entomophthora muscae]
MQTLSGYKFKYKFVKGELNILPDLLSCNPAMYPVRGNEDPQVTVIPESLILSDSASSPLSHPTHASSCLPTASGPCPCHLSGVRPPTGSPWYAFAQRSSDSALLSRRPGHLCKAVTQLCF